MTDPEARFLPRWQLDGISEAVVVIDVIRAFTTAAYAFGSGATAIYLVSTVEEALAFVRAHPLVLAMGEEHGRRIAGFAFSNSPVEVSNVNLAGRTLVQRTSAGTQGVIAAAQATRLWCASLVCASATARAVNSAKLGPPTYVITGRFQDRSDHSGSDDHACAEYIEHVRRSEQVNPTATVDHILNSEEARRTLLLGEGHTHADDIVFATRVDLFNFSMEVRRTSLGLCLRPVRD